MYFQIKSASYAFSAACLPEYHSFSLDKNTAFGFLWEWSVRCCEIWDPNDTRPDLPMQCQVTMFNIHAWNMFSQINLKKCPSKSCFNCFSTTTRWPDIPKEGLTQWCCHRGFTSLKMHYTVFVYLDFKRMSIINPCTLLFLVYLQK